QRDADIVRLQHLKYYGTLIEEYKEKTSHYPLEGRSAVPIYVHVAHDRQSEFTKKGPPTKHEVIPFADLIAELESGLGRPIDEYYDPQYFPTRRPNFYIYMIHRDAFFFAVHVEHA